MPTDHHDQDYQLELARRVYQLETIQEISLQINANRSSSEILKIILQSIIGTLGISEGVGMIYETANRALSIVVQQGCQEGSEALIVSDANYEVFVSTDQPIPVSGGKSSLFGNLLHTGCSDPAYFIPISAGESLLGAILLGKKLADKPFTPSDISFLRTIAAQSAVAIENAISYENVKDTQGKLQKSVAQLEAISKGIIDAMVTVVEMRDPYTAGHQRRVSEIACSIASELGMDEDTVSSIRMSGIVHDIGKISIPAEILSKPGKITEIEFSLIQTHAEIGYQILKSIEFPWPIAKIVRQHHEFYDGNGYPNGIRGNEILIEARILKVADTVEAYASHRPYRAGHGLKKAIELVKRLRGSENDPEIVDACLSVYSKEKLSLDGTWAVDFH